MRVALLAFALVLGCSDRSAGDESSASGSGSASESGSATDAGCDAMDTNPEHICCGGTWVDPRSDQFNCGDCGTTCTGDTPFCDQGECGNPDCSVETCPAEQTCCGSQCCEVGMICCTLNGPVESGPGCVAPDESGTCPLGCAPLCRCAAPETPIATPSGDRPIAALARGDLVFSVDDGAIVAVPILRVQRVPAPDHRVARVVLDDGRTLRLSPDHPLADGRPFADLVTGQRLGDAVVVEADIVAYDGAFTHDILPMSSSGAYFVAGELVASTIPTPVCSGHGQAWFDMGMHGRDRMWLGWRVRGRER